MNALVLISLLPLAAPAGDICNWFDSQMTATVGTTPHAFAAADFNEDGILDLAVANQSSHNISILIGTGTAGVGDGGFLAAVNYPSGQYPLDVAAADFNGDGQLDLAVTVQHQIAFYFGRGTAGIGDGTFDPAVYRASSGFRPRGLTTADFNEDGIADLAITNGAGTTIGIWLGQGTNGVGDATFAAEVAYFVGLAPVRVATPDLNEDGIADIVATVNHPTSNKVSVLLGNGSGGRGNGTFGTVTQYAAGAAPLGIAVADFNADSIQDLAITNATSLDLSILFGQGSGGVGNGTFGADSTIALGASAREVEAGDWDQDGVIDLAVALGSNEVAILKGGTTLGIPDGTFAVASSKPVGSNPVGLEADDFLEDGIPDLVVTNASGASAGVLPGSCEGEDPAFVEITSPPGGATWALDTEQQIAWTKSPSIPLVDIELSRDAGLNWQTLATGIGGSSWTWSVTGPLTSTALLRVSDSNSNVRNDTTPIFAVVEEAVGVPEHPGLPGAVARPNPFRSQVRLDLDLPGVEDDLFVAVFDVTGRLVARLHSGPAAAGPRSFHWDGRLEDGGEAGPGIYFLRARGISVNGGLKVVRID